MTTLSRARLLAVMVPTLLLGGALVSQYGFGLVPCEMCLWQRWPHLAAILLALAAITLRGHPPRSRSLTMLAAVAILLSGAIGVFHAGVEYHWWQGLTRCATPAMAGSAHDMMAQIMTAPLVRCDQAQWRLWGVSLAGWNAILSLGFGGVILWLTAKHP
ncbi:disulfide bond formation protein B [Sphingomonas sp.]|uniref:disulfide bond formation protein B n=1 Tax=Sphingomonas sp. TaxID=28214 RepID=UPI003B006F4F